MHFLTFRNKMIKSSIFMVDYNIKKGKMQKMCHKLAESIIEDGSHQELMERNGCYAEMYREQAKWYQ